MQESEGEKRVQAWRAAANEVAQRGEASPAVLRLMHGMLADLGVQTHLADVNAQLSARHMARAQNAEAAAGYDGMTGLLSKEGLQRVFAVEAAQQQRHPDRPASAMVVCDKDRFKMVNDTYGHSVGDDLIRHIGNILRPPQPGGGQAHNLLRAGDKAARFGGDEFVLILSEVGEDNAAKMVPLLQERIQREKPFTFVDEKTGKKVSLPVKISMGLAMFTAPTSGEAPEEHFLRVFKQADAALYDNKGARRDQEIASKPLPERLRHQLRSAIIRLANKL